MKSRNSKRNYGKALDSLFRFCASQPLYRETLLAWKASMTALSPSTINVRLSAARKLISEARKMGVLTHEDAANLTDVPNRSRRSWLL